MKKIILLVFLLLLIATVNIAKETESTSYSEIRKSRTYLLPEIPAEYGNLISGEMSGEVAVPGGGAVYQLFFQNEAGVIRIVRIIFYYRSGTVYQMDVAEFPRS